MFFFCTAIAYANINNSDSGLYASIAKKQVLNNSSFKSADQELIDHLVIDSQDHLFVGKLSGGVATCGPLVRPSRTPCIRCLTLGDAERFGQFHNRLSAASGTSEEFPIAIAHQVAAIAAHTALRFIDTGESTLMGAQIHLNYLEPYAPTIHRFSRHPSCACQWSGEEK